MGKNSGIEWTDATHGFWYGCRKVSPGCKFCYAERDMNHYGRDFTTITRSKSFNKPLNWRDPIKIFINPWSDFFIKDADEWRAEAWSVIKRTPHLQYQILTKRPELIEPRLPADWGAGYPNVWLGVSVESQAYINRLYVLLTIPARIHWVSYEPALGELDITDIDRCSFHKLDWLVSGGESGAKDKIRPANPEWFRWIKYQCSLLGVAYFHKQNGGSKKIDGSWGGCEIDGQIYKHFPEYHNPENLLFTEG